MERPIGALERPQALEPPPALERAKRNGTPHRGSGTASGPGTREALLERPIGALERALRPGPSGYPRAVAWRTREWM